MEATQKSSTRRINNYNSNHENNYSAIRRNKSGKSAIGKSNIEKPFSSSTTVLKVKKNVASWKDLSPQEESASKKLENKKTEKKTDESIQTPVIPSKGIKLKDEIKVENPSNEQVIRRKILWKIPMSPQELGANKNKIASNEEAWPTEKRVEIPVEMAGINKQNREPQQVRVNLMGQKILFSQDSVSCTTSQGVPLEVLAHHMRIKFDPLQPLEVVYMGVKDGCEIFTSVDNRRLVVAKQIAKYMKDYTIWVKVHYPNDHTKRTEKGRFGGMWNWGLAVKYRCKGFDNQNEEDNRYVPGKVFDEQGDIIGYDSIPNVKGTGTIIKINNLFNSK